MAKSPITVQQINTIDVTGPGAPGFVSFVQTSNAQGDLSVILALGDSDGSPLTGLTHLTVVSCTTDPTGLDYAAVVALPGAQTSVIGLTPADAGTTKVVQIPVIQPNSPQFEAFWCDDE